MTAIQVPALKDLMSKALASLPESSLDEMIATYNDEKRRRKIAASNNTYSIETVAMYNMIMERAFDADMDQLSAALDTLDGRDTATWVEGDGMFLITTVIDEKA